MTLESQLFIVVRQADSLIDLPLLEEGKLAPSTGITRADLVFKRDGQQDLTISSSQDPSWFTLQQVENIDGAELPIVRVNLKQITNPPTDGRYKVDVYLWDSQFTAGRLWGTIDVEVRPGIPDPHGP